MAAFRTLLEVRTREREPLGWAWTQAQLGTTLRRLGEGQEDTAHLKEAIATLQAALEEFTREEAPLSWARTQWELGGALFALGERTVDLRLLQRAETSVHNAFQVFMVEVGYTQYEPYFRERLEDLERVIAAVKLGLGEAR